jgi:hypothetical protein
MYGCVSIKYVADDSRRFRVNARNRAHLPCEWSIKDEGPVPFVEWRRHGYQYAQCGARGDCATNLCPGTASGLLKVSLPTTPMPNGSVQHECCQHAAHESPR